MAILDYSDMQTIPRKLRLRQTQSNPTNWRIKSLCCLSGAQSLVYNLSWSWMQIVFKNVWAFDTCGRALALTLRVPLPSLQPTPNNTRKERQSFQETLSLPPTSPDDSLRFFGASWAFCAEALFYTREWRDHGDDDEFNKEWRWVMNERRGVFCLFAIFTGRINA